MLRSSALPAPPPKRVDDFELRLGVHDLSRLEWTTAVQLPATGERRYDVQFSIEIPSNVFSAHEVWEHLQIYTRLQSPLEEGPIELARHDLEELRRDVLGVAHRLKTLGYRFERLCAGAVATTTAPADINLEDELSACVTQAADLVAELRRQLNAPGILKPDLARECQLADEFLSHQLVGFYAGAERALDDVLLGPASPFATASPPFAEELRTLLGEGLSEELAWRRGRGWVVPAEGVPAELGRFLERASRLKKHFQDVLFPDVEAYFVDSRIHYWVTVVTAALAAVVFLAITMLPIRPEARAGVGIGTFLLVFAGAYALRDVIKEVTRGWITGGLRRLYGQRVVTLRLPARIDPGPANRRVLLETRESFDVASRLVAGDAEAAIGRPRKVMSLAFRMRATLHSSAALERAHIRSVKHIFRYDLSPMFGRLDNAVKQVPVLDPKTRRVRFCDAPKEYRFATRIAVVAGDGVVAEQEADVVVSKRGIERVEPRPTVPRSS